MEGAGFRLEHPLSRDHFAATRGVAKPRIRHMSVLGNVKARQLRFQAMQCGDAARAEALLTQAITTLRDMLGEKKNYIIKFNNQCTIGKILAKKMR